MKEIKEQRCISKLKIFLLALSFAYLIKGLTGSYSKSMLIQIERRFNISTSLAGIIDGSFEIGNLLVIAFVSYFGRKSHRPRIIATGCVLQALGCCLMALPHFLMGRYHYEQAVSSANSTSSSMSLCVANQNQSSIPLQQISPEYMKEGNFQMWIFVMMGNILRGIGETPVVPLGLSYVEDFAKTENSSFYIGFIHAVGTAGMGLGFLLASFCAKLYVDTGSINLDDITLSLADTRWVGAWWLGYLISGTVSLLVALPFCFLPNTLPKESVEDETEISIDNFRNPLKETERNKGQESKEKIMKDSLPCLKSLSSNSVYVLILCITVLQLNANIGSYTFMSKNVEIQYGKSSSDAIFLIGIYTIPLVCIGSILGGLYMKTFKVTTLQAAKTGLFSSVLLCLINFLGFAVFCKNSKVAGLTVSYEGYEQVYYSDALKSNCNLECMCPTNIWDPVCGDNGITYTTACLAGCESSIKAGQNTVFTNCSCLHEVSASLYGNASAVPGQCQREKNCGTMLQYFLIVMLLSSLAFSFGTIPGYMVLMRSLKPEEKSLGIGIHLLVFRTLAGIPSPIYYGAMIDTTCLKWGTTRYGTRGACRMYDSDAYRFVIFGVTAILRTISFIPCAFIINILKRQPVHDENKASMNTEIEMPSKGQENNFVDTDNM